MGVAGLRQGSLFAASQGNKVGKMQLWLQKVVVVILLSCVVESQAQSESVQVCVPFAEGQSELTDQTVYLLSFH